MLKEKEIVLGFLDKLQEWGWLNLEGLQYGRGDKTDGAIYESKLFEQIKKINPYSDYNTINRAIEKLLTSKNNQEAFKYLREGVRVDFRGENKYVQFIDFNPANLEKNKFSYFPWLRIRSQHNNNLETDLILFINYLPVVVLEFKDEFRAGKNWKKEAFQQMKDYEKDLPQIFLFNAFNVLSNGDDFLIGTATSEIFHYTSWQFETNNLFSRSTILDIIQNYLVFDKEKKKKIARYHQYNCVKESLKIIENSSLKGGINNHTTGSGKSDTMAFLTNQLRQKHPQCTILVITDRNELDKQIYERFQNYEDIFFTAGDLIVIETIKELKKQLASSSQGKIIFTLIQKFQELPIFHNSAGIFVLIDEAHRSQNLIADEEQKKVSWAWEMRRVFPQAFFLGFTATPIVGKTYLDIGPLIHNYSVSEALQNEIVVPIVYEKAYEYLPALQWDEEKFDHHFPQKEKKFFDKRDMKKNRKDIFYESPQRIEMVCEFFKKDYENFSYYHYLKGEKPKVMYMAYNVETAYRFFRQLEQDSNYKNSSCLIVSEKKLKPDSSIHHPQPTEIIKSIGNEEENISNIKEFKTSHSSISIAIVVDKLTTGFNMENLERIYLDQEISAPHSFFQKISRVNRKYPGKDHGFIVDLSGNEKTYKEVLKKYFEDKNGGENISEELENLWNFFADFHPPKTELIQLLFSRKQIDNRSFFTEASNYCLSPKKSEEERKEFAAKTKFLRLILGSRRYIIGKEKSQEQRNLEFVDWCFRLSSFFNDIIDIIIDGPPLLPEGREGKKIESREVEKISGETIKTDKIDFNNFDFSKIEKEMMIDPKKHPDIIVWFRKAKIRRSLNRIQRWWFSIEEWEESFKRLLREHNEKKISDYDLGKNLEVLEKSLEKESQAINQEIAKDRHYPLKQKITKWLLTIGKENNYFANELVDYFLKLNKTISDWISRDDKRKEGRKEINEKSKKYFGEGMLSKHREELILLFENYFLSEHYFLVAKESGE